jgi:enhancing lycopene biosynthesis protein 2
MTKVAVVLSGCGVFDGTEIHEAVCVLVHLSRAGARCDCFAPDADQMHTVNHLTGQPASDQRNVLVESARIARGKIAPLDTLDVEAYDAVIFPGGFGAAKNLCDFAQSGADCTVTPSVERVVRAFHKAGKPVGMCCIAPVIAARVLGTAAGGPGCMVTIGNDAGTAAAIAAMGSTNVERPVTRAFTDEPNRLVTAPAYMYDAKPHEVFEGIGAMVDGVLALARRS